MLLELRIRDFAIIEGLDLALGPGLNIFTGETGAGKSIIMDAVSLILGDRASNELIRTGSDEAMVEALFDISGAKGLDPVLREAGIPTSGELVIKRVVQKAGRNRIYINGSLATLMTLTEVGRRLIDIYGQSEHQSLTRPEEHLEALDSFAGLVPARAEMLESYKSFMELKKEFDALSHEAGTLAERKAQMEYQSRELTEADLKPGEDEAIKKEYERLRNFEKISSAAEGAERALYSDAGSVVERLGSVVKALKEVSAHDSRIDHVIEPLEAGLFNVEDAARTLRGFSSGDADPQRLEVLAARLDFINKLKRKYNLSLSELSAKKEALGRELQELSNTDERLKAVEKNVAEAREKAAKIRASLAVARAGAAVEFKAGVERELSDLGMKGTRFEVAVETEKNSDNSLRFNERGADRVSFQISPNRGEALKPLSRIASGGELSRIMLSMKNISSAGRVPTLIFDEIDTGISGVTAQAVGLKLKEVSRSHQVLCITHMPQVSAFADSHFSVRKSVNREGRTTTTVASLSGPERIEEISKMLGGVKVTDTTIKHATELVEAALDLSSAKRRATAKAASPGAKKSK